MWRVGEKASLGVELLAETGGTSKLQEEIRAVGAATDVPISISGLITNGTTPATTKTFKKTHPLLSLESMVAPTADWFVGLSSYCVLDALGNWKSDVTIPLRIYDAGTEQDNTLFSLGNTQESPHKNISVFQGNAEAGFEESNNAQYIGAIRLEKM